MIKIIGGKHRGRSIATPEGMTMLGVSFNASPMKATGMPSNLRMV